jgi:hypothetical protein
MSTNFNFEKSKNAFINDLKNTCESIGYKIDQAKLDFDAYYKQQKEYYRNFYDRVKPFYDTLDFNDINKKLEEMLNIEDLKIDFKFIKTSYMPAFWNDEEKPYIMVQSENLINKNAFFNLLGENVFIETQWGGIFKEDTEEKSKCRNPKEKYEFYLHQYPMMVKIPLELKIDAFYPLRYFIRFGYASFSEKTCKWEFEFFRNEYEKAKASGTRYFIKHPQINSF